MSILRNHLSDAVTDALRSNHSLRKRTLRGALANIKQAEVDNRTILSEADITAVLQKEIKSHQESMADAKKAGRPDMASEMQERIAILQEFIPEQLSRAKIYVLAKAVIEDLDVNSPAQKGEIMKHLMPQLDGKADGKLVSSVVSELLSGKDHRSVVV